MIDCANTEAPVTTDLYLVDYDRIIESSQNDRDSANRLSDRRVDLAEPLSQLIIHGTDTALGRVVAGATLAYGWHTDRRDGILARRSISNLEKLCQQDPAVATYPAVQLLLSETTRAAGGKRDQEADKKFANRITAALLERAVRQGDNSAISVLGATALSTTIRDHNMKQLREIGQVNGLDVKAKNLGKLKTAMLATGQCLMTFGPTGRLTNRLGLGLIGASNLPSWSALAQMKLHVNRGLRAKAKTC